MNQEIEYFIEDWHWDKESHAYANKLCIFLFQFIADLERQELSSETIKKHRSYCWHIGKLDCSYGYREQFSPKDVFYILEVNYEYEFKRKMGDSKNALHSYKITWKKIYKYVKGLKQSLD